VFDGGATGGPEGDNTTRDEDRIHPIERYIDIYEKKKELGRGKFGVVYQVTDKASGGIMAAKRIKIRKNEHKQRKKEEIGILKNLSNPHVIKFVEAFENERELILVMEYLDGGELFERVATEDFNLTESDCCLFIRQLCRGVDYLHEKQIVHLDLKPENVVCTAKNSNSLKIIDFGLAKKISPSDKLKVMCGTPEFVAPEVVNYDFVDSSTDMWSVGVICYILLSGYSPFLGDTDAETYTNISSVQYDFDEPEFDDISENAKEFIRDLLKRRKNSRMTAKMCLDHPWLLEKGIGNQVINTDNLRKYLARRRWQKCGQAIRAIERMTGLMKRSTLSNSNINRDVAHFFLFVELKLLTLYVLYLYYRQSIIFLNFLK
jgi:myosin-light-chain kinase